MTESISWIPKFRAVLPGQTKTGKTSKEVKTSFENVMATRQREQDIKLAWQAIRRAPDIRLDKINLSKERLESGFYLSSQATEKIAENILRA